VKYAPGIGPVVPQQCSDCGKKFNVGGPIWSAPIHDQDWVLSTLTDVKAMKQRYPAYNKITSVLTTVSEVLLLRYCCCSCYLEHVEKLSVKTLNVL
jgi:tRNA (guanine26-N2/guanine27-N2)-dimethyltransferase